MILLIFGLINFLREKKSEFHNSLSISKFSLHNNWVNMDKIMFLGNWVGFYSHLFSYNKNQNGLCVQFCFF